MKATRNPPLLRGGNFHVTGRFHFHFLPKDSIIILNPFFFFFRESIGIGLACLDCKIPWLYFSCGSKILRSTRSVSKWEADGGSEGAGMWLINHHEISRRRAGLALGSASCRLSLCSIWFSCLFPSYKNPLHTERSGRLSLDEEEKRVWVPQKIVTTMLTTQINSDGEREVHSHHLLGLLSAASCGDLFVLPASVPLPSQLEVGAGALILQVRKQAHRELPASWIKHC